MRQTSELEHVVQEDKQRKHSLLFVPDKNDPSGQVFKHYFSCNISPSAQEVQLVSVPEHSLQVAAHFAQTPSFAKVPDGHFEVGTQVVWLNA